MSRLSLPLLAVWSRFLEDSLWIRPGKQSIASGNLRGCAAEAGARHLGDDDDDDDDFLGIS